MYAQCNFLQVSVFVGPQLEDKKGETTEVEWWIILLAVLGAIILIAASIAGLYKASSISSVLLSYVFVCRQLLFCILAIKLNICNSAFVCVDIISCILDWILREEERKRNQRSKCR